MFCSNCGTLISGAFCSQCGAPSSSVPQTVQASEEQVVIAQILIYVMDHWSEDFEEFLEEIPDALEVARALNDNPTSAVTASQLNLIEMTFGEFISGGGFPRGTRFSSLEEFIEEMDEG